MKLRKASHAEVTRSSSVDEDLPTPMSMENDKSECTGLPDSPEVKHPSTAGALATARPPAEQTFPEMEADERQPPSYAGSGLISNVDGQGGNVQRSLLSGGTYALANAAQRALAFILLPLYTTVLSSSEYGRLGLLLTLQAGTVVIFSAGMENGMIRQFFQLEGDPTAQRRFVITTWNFLAVASLGLAAVVALLLFAFIPSTPAFNPSEGALAVIGAATFVGATVVPLTVLRIEQRLKDYMTLTAVTGISSSVLAILFVVVLRLGVSGWIGAVLLANAVTLIAGLFIIPWGRVGTSDREGLRAALKLGIPLVPHGAAGWSLQLADRIILASLVTVSSLGVYTLAANLSLPALVLLQGLNLGFLPSYARTRNRAHAVLELRNTVSLQVVLTLLVGCLVALLGPPVVSLLSNAYAGATSSVPWIVLGYVFLGIYMIPMNFISMVVGRTTFVWTLTLTAAAINIGTIYLLVPRYGIVGAAEASAIGYFALLVLVAAYAWAIKIKAPIDWGKIVPMTVVAAATFILGVTILPGEGLVGLLARTALLMTLPFTLALSGGISPAEMLAQGRRIQVRLRPS
jgi:O-antigen/teichoic acid export membrane protein